jgi:hypothetical protein
MNTQPNHTLARNSTLRRISRRGMLRAAGICVGLPWLESLAPNIAYGAEPAQGPRRLAYLYIPNGVNVPMWQVSGSGKDYELSPTLQPLAKLRDEFTVISNLNHENATPGPDGGGDHSRATATYLTGVRPKKTGGSDIRNGISIDQFIANQIGNQTRLPSLELSTDGARLTGRCDSGYSCAYQFNLSWANETRPVPSERDPRAVFERLFGTGDTGYGNAEARQQLRQSVLDFVLDDANALSKNVSKADQDKLDQYLSSLRDVEQRIDNTEQQATQERPADAPSGIPDSYTEHIRTMFDMLTLAFQSDATRMVTFVLSYDGSNRAFPEIGIPEAHHQLSHHRGDEEKLKKIARIDRFYVEQLAWYLEKLKTIRDGNGTLLDNAMLVYGGCISEGNQHLHSNLPIVLAGRGGGTLTPGTRLEAPDPTPMCNLHVALAQRMGVNLERFGDSTERLKGI